jgi:hypothetical protein
MSRKTSLKKKKQRNVNNVPKTKKTKEPSSLFTFHSPSRNPGPERYSLKKKKGMLATLQRKKRIILDLLLIIITQAKIQRPLDKRRKRNVNDVPKTKKKQKIHLPTYLSTFQAEIHVQGGVP